jgi:hypothetical protein
VCVAYRANTILVEDTTFNEPAMNPLNLQQNPHVR